MRSTSFGSIVSPLGTPAQLSTRNAPSRAPSGGLTALGPKITAPKLFSPSQHELRTPTLHHPKLTAMSGVTGRGQGNLKLASGAPKSAGGIALPRMTPKVGTGQTRGYAKGGSVKGKLASARAKLGPAKKVVDMVEGDKVVVRHTFYGKDKKEAAHMQRSHEKADRSFRAAEQGKPYKGIDIKALVRKARGGGVFPHRFGEGGYEDGGSIPSFDQYLASDAAPKGLTSDEYQRDYDNYVSDLYRAQSGPERYTPGYAVEQATGSGDKGLLAAGLAKDRNGDRITPDELRAYKDSQTKTLGAQAWAALPWAVPVLGTALMADDGINAIGHATGLMKEGDYEFPGFAHYLDAYQNLTGNDPHARDAAKSMDLALTAVNAPGIAKSLYGGSKWLAQNAGPKLRAFIQQTQARARDAKLNVKGSRMPQSQAEAMPVR